MRDLEAADHEAESVFLLHLFSPDDPGPMVVFMLKHLKLAGCSFTTDSIQCHPCPETLWGGFSPDHGVLLCQNRFPSKKLMEDTLAHELLHAFDHCRFDVDWSNLRHLACTEVSANRYRMSIWSRSGRRTCRAIAGGLERS